MMMMMHFRGEATSRARRYLAAGSALLLALGGAIAAFAQPDAVLRDFEPTSEYRLWVAGKEVPKAEVYDSQVAGAYLIVSSAFASPVLLGKRSLSVETVNLMKVAKQGDGSVDLLADATLDPLGTARVNSDYTEISFAVAGKAASLKAAPPLLGNHSRADLLSHSPEYARDAAAYKPDPLLLNRLRGQLRDVKIRVFFGSWCPHCRQMLPRALKVDEGLAGSKVAFEYYGLPRPPAAWQDAEVVRLGVKGVPTAIVYVAGREAGRLSSADFVKVEQSLSSVLEKK